MNRKSEVAVVEWGDGYADEQLDYAVEPWPPTQNTDLYYNAKVKVGRRWIRIRVDQTEEPGMFELRIMAKRPHDGAFGSYRVKFISKFWLRHCTK